MKTYSEMLRRNEKMLRVLVPVVSALVIITLIATIFGLHVRAKRHFRECVAAKGYSVECLAEYEMERPYAGR